MVSRGRPGMACSIDLPGRFGVWMEDLAVMMDNRPERLSAYFAAG